MLILAGFAVFKLLESIIEKALVKGEIGIKREIAHIEINRIVTNQAKKEYSSCILKQYMSECGRDCGKESNMKPIVAHEIGLEAGEYISDVDIKRLIKIINKLDE